MVGNITFLCFQLYFLIALFASTNIVIVKNKYFIKTLEYKKIENI